MMASVIFLASLQMFSCLPFFVGSLFPLVSQYAACSRALRCLS
jgi:hypothetical protein